MEKQIKDIRISIVVPVLNEEDTLHKFHQEIIHVLRALDEAWELIYADDGSTDNTFKVLKEIANKDKSVKVIQFPRSFGQTAALSAAIKASNGGIIIPIDADLQNDPKDIPRLITKLYEGYDVVSGWRRNRKDKFFSRRLPSYIANRLISLIGGLKLHDYGCSLKAYRRKFLEGIILYGEMHRFLPLFAFWQGARITEIEVNHRPRTSGKSKYNILRAFNVILDLLTVRLKGGYISKPIYLFGKIGIFFCIIGILSGFLPLYDKYFKRLFIPENLHIWLTIFLFIIGFLLIAMGIMTELFIRTYYEIEGKEPFIIKNKINID